MKENPHQHLSVDEQYLLAARRTLAIQGGPLQDPDSIVTAEDHAGDLRLLIEGITTPYVEALKQKAAELKPAKSWTSLKDLRQNHIAKWQYERPDMVYPMNLHYSSRAFPKHFEMHTFELKIDPRTDGPTVQVGLGLNKNGIQLISCQWWRRGDDTITELKGDTIREFSRVAYSNASSSHWRAAELYIDLMAEKPIFTAQSDQFWRTELIDNYDYFSQYAQSIYTYSPSENAFLATRRFGNSLAPQQFTARFGVDLIRDVLGLIPTEEAL